MAKHIVGCTLGTHPEVYPYLLKHVGMSAARSSLTEQATQASAAGMMGAPDEAGFLAWLVQLMGAKKCVEVGVFRGSTTLALAEALPQDGKIVALDVSEEYVKMGQAAWRQAGLDHKIDLRIGDARQTITALADTAGEAGTYDLVFIDADKTGYDTYYEQGLRLLRQGGVVAIDNTLWHGEIVDENNTTADTVAIRAINDKVRDDPRVSSVMLPVADGLYLARKL